MLTLGVFLTLLFLSGSFQMIKDNYDIPVTFKYISGLQKNAPVHVAGFKVGKVTDIRFLGGEESGVLVTCSVTKDVVLKKDAEAYINVAGFMGEMFIEFFSGSPSSPRLQPGERLKGTDPIPLMELVKRGSQLLDQFENCRHLAHKVVVPGAVQCEGAAVEVQRPKRKPLATFRGGSGKRLQHGEILLLKTQQVRSGGLVTVVARVEGRSRGVSRPITRDVRHVSSAGAVSLVLVHDTRFARLDVG